jgi:hypothetical protein
MPLNFAFVSVGSLPAGTNNFFNPLIMNNFKTKHKHQQESDDDSSQNRSLAVLNAAYRAWLAWADFRKIRRRNKNFTYGSQWNDLTRDSDGNVVTEYEEMAQNGKEPITNNLIRQLVKSVVGRFRNDLQAPSDECLKAIHSSNLLDELDSRSLEEFLISGCCIQRIGFARHFNRRGIRIDNVNPNRFFCNALSDSRGWDCEIVGQIHDLSLTEIIMRIADSDRNLAAWIRNVYCNLNSTSISFFASSIGADAELGDDFWHARTNRCRAIEVWTLESHEILRCHDVKSADFYYVDYDRHDAVEEENRSREEAGEPLIITSWDIIETWHCRWYAPDGTLLAHFDSPYANGAHPFIMKLYPLTDGEIHSFVEDVIDQQKYVNRLITMVDHIMGASAKGVLLFPEKCMPAGYSWERLKQDWSKTDSIIPYNTVAGEKIPQQISTNATNMGAYEMLSLQMRLFEEISGVSGALQGRTSNPATGAQLYNAQAQNSAITLSDIFCSFQSFRSERDSLALACHEA